MQFFGVQFPLCGTSSSLSLLLLAPARLCNVYGPRLRSTTVKEICYQEVSNDFSRKFLAIKFSTFRNYCAVELVN